MSCIAMTSPESTPSKREQESIATQRRVYNGMDMQEGSLWTNQYSSHKP